MNGKPQLVFGQAQFSGADALMNKTKYAKPSLMPVGKGNSFASILSSTVDKSAPAAPVAGRLASGGQGSFMDGVASFLGINTSSGQAPQGGPVQDGISQRTARQAGVGQGGVGQGGVGQGGVSQAGASRSNAVSRIGGATVQAATQANTVPKRVSVIPKNYSFGMEDTRPAARTGARATRIGAKSVQPVQSVQSVQTVAAQASGTVKKAPAVAKTSSSARAINIAATQEKSASGAFPITEQFVAGNGTFRATPYRGLAISQSGMDKNLMTSLNKKGSSKGSFYSPLLSGGATQLLIQIVKEAGHVVGTVGEKLRLKNRPALAQATPVAASNGDVNKSAYPTQTTSAQTRWEGGRSSMPGKLQTTVPSGAASVLYAGINGVPLDASSLGALSAKFESGENGIAAIGYDRHGGTSYGKYQISSRAGTFSKFLDYLEVNAPDIEAKLRAGGPANTGGRRGKMPDIWKSIAAAEPERFEQLQTDFIMSSHFQPAMSAITEATGLAFGAMPEALREVVFSTAVQHGVSGAAKIISRAVASVGAEKLTDGEKTFAERTGQDLIRQIYNIRAGQFSSSTSSVRRAVQNRLQHEMHDALALLRISTVPQRPDTRRAGNVTRS